jgi:hypothetical protein
MECFSHSAAHSSQTSAQSEQICGASSLPRPIQAAATRQICAQSVSTAMQRAIAFGSSSFRHIEAQCSHASAQALQASIQDLCSWCDMETSGRQAAAARPTRR